MKTLYDRIADGISNTGRSFISVAEDHPFTYSIGNALVGLPELIVFRLWPTDACPLLNTWSKMMIDRGAAFVDGEMIDIGGAHPCMAVACDDHVRQRYTVQAGRFLDAECYAVMQILVPDKSGRFPTDPACDPLYRDVPVLRRPAVLQ